MNRRVLVALLALSSPLAMALACSTRQATSDAAPPGQPKAGSQVATPPAAAPGGECQAHADCAPAQCCHPTSCAPAAQKPDCGDTFCTEECRRGTMDCGGGCACVEGSCSARYGSFD